MRARTLTLAAAIALALTLTPAAQAKSYWARAYPIAVAYWHRGEPCDGHVTVRWAAPPAPMVAWAAWANEPNGGAPARACTVTYSPAVRWNWTYFCNATAHEVGHLLGYHHTDAISVMNPVWARRPALAACA